ncbi:MAG: tetratricopeptide repeat protein [Alphaproteobacteria bacterium]
MSGGRGLAHNLAMRLLLSVLLVSAGIWSVSPVLADQTDPRLDNLFGILQSSDQRIELRAAENLIWATWLQHDNTEYERLMRRGAQAMGERRYDQAIGIFSSLIQKATDYAEAWNKRATVYFLIGDLSLSIKDVDRTLELEPRHFGALSGLGQIELLRGNGDAALKAFEGALRVHPGMSGIQPLIDKLEDEVRGRPL